MSYDFALEINNISKKYKTILDSALWIYSVMDI